MNNRDLDAKTINRVETKKINVKSMKWVAQNRAMSGARSQYCNPKMFRPVDLSQRRVLHYDVGGKLTTRLSLMYLFKSKITNQ